MNIQRRSVLIKASNQQSNTKGPAHDTLLSVSALTEPEGQIADGLGAALDTKRLGVVEGVVLGSDAGVLDHAAGVGLEAGHGGANVGVDFDNLLDGRGFQKGGGDAFFYAEDDAF